MQFLQLQPFLQILYRDGQNLTVSVQTYKRTYVQIVRPYETSSIFTFFKRPEVQWLFVPWKKNLPKNLI